MTLINDNFEQKVKRIKTDESGTFMILDMVIEDKEVTLVNIYGPNNDNPQFYEQMKQKIEEFQNDHVLICVDWNMIMDVEMDSFNYVNINNPRARQSVLQLLDQENFIDPWRLMHENKKQYTWRRLNPTKKQARLDFFIIHESLFHYVTNTDIIPGYRTDHSAIILKLKFQNNERGKGYWKFNNSLLKDTQYIDKIEKIIEDVKQTYATNLNPDEIIPNQDLQFNINDQLFLETLLMMIRGDTIKYSSIKKKLSCKEEQDLEKEIKDLEDNINTNFSHIINEQLNTLAQKIR